MFFSLKEKNQKKRTFFKRKYQRITLNKIIKGTDVLSQIRPQREAEFVVLEKSHVR